MSGQGVVETVSCMRIQKRDPIDKNDQPTCSKRLKVDTQNSGNKEHRCNGKGLCKCRGFDPQFQGNNSTKLERANITMERQRYKRGRSMGVQTDFDIRQSASSSNGQHSASHLHSENTTDNSDKLISQRNSESENQTTSNEDQSTFNQDDGGGGGAASVGGSGGGGVSISSTQNEENRTVNNNTTNENHIEQVFYLDFAILFFYVNSSYFH